MEENKLHSQGSVSAIHSQDSESMSMVHSQASVSATCQNCKKSFLIEAEDFVFYKKIDVPAPTWCPDCRMIRRTLFRNVRSLYRRECALCKKSIVAMYAPSDAAPVYCNECWKGDGWDAITYGTRYDATKNFFSQWYELFQKTPRFPLWKVGTIVNSEYTNYSLENKNCYFVYSALRCEDTRYCECTDYSKNTFDCYQVKDLESCYENVDANKNYNCIFLNNSRSCFDCAFLFDCTNCSNCFMSANIRNKQYVFRGKQLSKDAYKEALEKETLGSFSSFENLKKEFTLLIENAVHKYADLLNAIDSTGNHIANARNVKHCFSVYDVENVKYSIRIPGGQETMDVYGAGKPAVFMYDCLACSFGSYMNKFSVLCEGSKNIEYSMLCNNSSDLFGCVGLKNKSYCILNVQYTKEAYEALVPKIRQDMNSNPFVSKTGPVYTYGEFFPVDFAPHPYNCSIALDLFPKDKVAAEKMGATWEEAGERDYNITKEAKDLPEHIQEVEDTITKEVIRCPQNGLSKNKCTIAYRILPEDIAFYKKMNVPLPRLCPNCRHYDRFLRRTPFSLWNRTCTCIEDNHAHKGGCMNKFETSYAPERPEKVYCESCYQQAVL